MEIVLVLDNIRSVYNVGAILRTFEGFGGKQVICSGVTPCGYVTRGDGTRAANSELMPYVADKLDRQVAKTALGAEVLLKISYLRNILPFLQAEKVAGSLILGLENNLDDSRVVRLSKISKHLRGSQRVILVLGEEVSGISTEVRKLCDLFAEIPMKGRKESFNVSVATGVALYELTNSN